MSNTPTVLVLPFPAQGHINPLMSLSHNLVDHGCKVIFVNTDFNHNRMLSSRAEQGTDRIEMVSIPDGLKPEDDRSDLVKLTDAIRSTMPGMFEKLLRQSVDCEEGSRRIGCVVADLTMGWALEVASKVGVKGALMWTSSAALFAMMHHIPTLIRDGAIDSDGFPTMTKNFQISPSMPLMDTRSFFWTQMYDSKSDQKKIFDYVVTRCFGTINSTEWWLCNTSNELEPAPLSFVPKLIPIGPLLRTYDDKNPTTRSLGQLWEEDLSCMSWLDSQPHRSVLYVAFGSFTVFDQKQFTELALGLELTNRPFLWVARQDSNRDDKFSYPKEFVGSKGKIVGWAPQPKVLSHPAIGCFVSHCGWNSTVEGLSNGVPFLCWPYFGDQFYDKTYICDELKVGLGFDLDQNGLVSREEIKTKVDQLLGDENIELRSAELKEKLMNTINEGGTSSNNFHRFVNWIKA